VPHSFSFLKWPNDIYIDDCKVSGILSEGVLGQGAFQGVVSGIGINVNNPMGPLRDKGIRAVSLSEVSGNDFSIEKMRSELVNLIRKYYIMCQFHLSEMLALWKTENRLLGEELVLDMPSGERRQGVFYDLADSGEMLIRQSDGMKFSFDCGYVKIDTSLIDFKSLKNKYNMLTK
jgi:BirA family biotin operon repressor/biotin-[acetyl-CoA-carboxylase] ligase